MRNDGMITPSSIDPAVIPMTISTDPAGDAAVSTTIIDNYSGVIITLTGAGNAQTLQNPTDTTAGKYFVVVADDGNGANTIEVNGITMSAGEAQRFIWDGSAWGAVSAVDADDITFTPAGDIVATDVQAAIEELDSEKLAKANNLSDVADASISFGNIKQAASITATGVSERSTDAEALTGNDTERHLTPANLKYVLDNTWSYGVSWDESGDSYLRTGSLLGVAVGSSPGDVRIPIQALMRRCVLSDAGIVQYYLNAADSTLKADGEVSDLTGTDGQVMVEIPAFYYKYSYSGTTHTWEISFFPLAGFSLHPAFIKNGEYVAYRYIGAYEGIGYDNGTSAYFDGDDVGDSPATNWPGGTAIDLVNDKLGSVSGFAPLMNETRAEFRSICSNLGTGWRQQDFYLISAIQFLYLTEYASWNSQSMIGMGRTELIGGTWAKDSYIGVTGKSNGDGNGTNSVGGNTNNAYMTYRGIENFFGNVWKWVDGFNINGGIPYVSNTDTDFADDTATGAGATYARLEDINSAGITLPQGVNDYQSTLERIAGGFLPSALGGASNTYITDYYYQSTGWRVARLGGGAALGLHAGVACWSLSSALSGDGVDVGGRLCR